MTDDKFNKALKIILLDEGGYSNNRDDPGGETNFGITQRTLDVCWEILQISSSVRLLKADDVEKFYKKMYWDKYKYEKIDSFCIACKVFSFSVNMGARNAHTILQDSLNEFDKKLMVDGIVGDKTLNACNEVCKEGNEGDLLDEIVQRAIQYYERLVDFNPKLSKFLNGWINRARRQIIDHAVSA